MKEIIDNSTMKEDNLITIENHLIKTENHLIKIEIKMVDKMNLKRMITVCNLLTKVRETKKKIRIDLENVKKKILFRK